MVYGHAQLGEINIIAIRMPLMSESALIDLFHIVSAHTYIGHVTRYFSIIGETLHRWGKRILSR